MEGNFCDCGEEKTIVIQSEDDGNIKCDVLGIFDVEGYDGEYIALMPENSEEDVYIYRYVQFKDGDFSIYNIESSEEMTAAESAFMDNLDLWDDEYEDDVEVDDEFVYDDED